MVRRKRNYRKQHDDFHGTEKQKNYRVARNKARRKAEREGRVRKGDGKEIDHKRSLSRGGGNGRENLRVVSRRANRRKGAGSR